MINHPNLIGKRSTRRNFLKRSTVLLAGVGSVARLPLARSAHAAGSDVIKIALIGCGGRGTGAAVQAMRTKANVKLFAMADATNERLQSSLKAISRRRVLPLGVIPATLIPTRISLSRSNAPSSRARASSSASHRTPAAKTILYAAKSGMRWLWANP